jgi:hypothetical protein
LLRRFIPQCLVWAYTVCACRSLSGSRLRASMHEAFVQDARDGSGNQSPRCRAFRCFDGAAFRSCIRSGVLRQMKKPTIQEGIPHRKKSRIQLAREITAQLKSGMQRSGLAITLPDGPIVLLAPGAVYAMAALAWARSRIAAAPARNTPPVNHADTRRPATAAKVECRCPRRGVRVAFTFDHCEFTRGCRITF